MQENANKRKNLQEKGIERLPLIFLMKLTHLLEAILLSFVLCGLVCFFVSEFARLQVAFFPVYSRLSAFLCVSNVWTK